MCPKKIYYLSYYGIPGDNRSYALSCVNKMNYIIQILNKLGYQVEIISFSTCETKFFNKGEYKKLSDNVYLKTFTCLNNKNSIFRFLSRKSIEYSFIKYLYKNLDSDSIVITYHSLGYHKLYKKIKNKVKLFVLEVEEIYTDVSNVKLANKDQELESINNADAYIFPTELMNNKFNKLNKKYSIIHGVYNFNYKKNKIISDNKIHVVYAGTFDLNKGGAVEAIRSSRYLDERYHLHIIGFGNDYDTSIIKNEIQQIQKSTSCIVTYDGLKTGEDFNNFLSGCHIGLSTQIIEGDFNNTSFPSKILTYLSCGLQVVSSKIPVVEQSGINNCVVYYEHQTSKSIADAVLSVDVINSRIMIEKNLKKLENEFIETLKEVLNEDR